MSCRDWNADVFIDLPGQWVVNIDDESVATFRRVALTNVELAEVNSWQ